MHQQMTTWTPEQLKRFLLESWPKKTHNSVFHLILLCAYAWLLMGKPYQKALRMAQKFGRLKTTNLRAYDLKLLNRLCIDGVLDQLDGHMSLERAIVDEHIKAPSVMFFRRYAKRKMIKPAIEILRHTVEWKSYTNATAATAATVAASPTSLPRAIKSVKAEARPLEIGIEEIK
jgi:hypothetical protein